MFTAVFIIATFVNVISASSILDGIAGGNFTTVSLYNIVAHNITRDFNEVVEETFQSITGGTFKRFITYDRMLRFINDSELIFQNQMKEQEKRLNQTFSYQMPSNETIEKAAELLMLDIGGASTLRA